MASVIFTMQDKSLSAWNFLIRVLAEQYEGDGSLVEIDTVVEPGSQEPKLIARISGKTDWIIGEDTWVFDDLVARSLLTSYEAREVHIVQGAEPLDPIETKNQEMRQLLDKDGPDESAQPELRRDETQGDASPQNRCIPLSSPYHQWRQPMTSPLEKTHDPGTLEALLAQGLQPFYAWVRKMTRQAEPVTFQEGHLAANPVASYINAQLGDSKGRAHLYEGVVYTAGGAKELPDDFQRFLRDLHEAFAGQYVSAGVLADWIAQGRPRPYRPDLPELFSRRHEEICQAMGQAVALVRQGIPDPNQPTDEECLGAALSKFFSWDAPRIARTCLRFCYAALEDANCATMERLLCEHFGEETFR